MKTANLILFLGILLAACSALPSQGAASLATGGGLLTSPLQAATPAGQQQNRTISVSGDAEVKVVPDQVILTLGVETWDKNLSIAKTQNDQIVQALLAMAKNEGIDPKNIQTDYISIEPRYQDNYTQKSFVGYFVRKTVVITISDISKFEEVLSGALEAGANYVQGIQFRTTELRKYRDQARALAIKAAQEKAVALAGTLNLQVGDALAIHEEQNNWYSSYSSFWGGWGAQMSQNVVQNAGGSAQWSEDSSLAPGQISVRSSVTAEFALK